MSNDQLLSILHLSDFHFSRKKWREQEIVVNALISDLEAICVGHRRPDLIIFSGDLVQAAGQDSHLDAYDRFLSRVSAATGCAEERIFLAPGNHDASQIIVASTLGQHRHWREATNDQAKLNRLYDDGEFSSTAQAKFEDFRELVKFLSHSRVIHESDFVTVFRIEALNVEVVILNTGLLSSAGHKDLGADSNQLAVPEYAIRDALKELTPDSFRIFCTHHPLTYLSEPNCRDVRAAIQHSAHMHLYGHMHDPLSASSNSFQGELFSNQAGAIFTDRKKLYIGYSLICVERGKKFFETHIRSYYPDRSEFDEATDVIKGGKFYSSQQSREFWRSIAAPVDDVQFRAFLKNECYCSLTVLYESGELGDRNAHEMFVSPPMIKTEAKRNPGEDSAGTIEIPVKFEDLVRGDENVIIYGASEYGRTTVLRELQHQLLCDAGTVKFPRLPVVIDFDDIKHNHNALLRLVRSRAPISGSVFDVESLLNLGHMCVMFDDVVFSDPKRMPILRDFIARFPKSRYILSTLKRAIAPFGAHIVPETPVIFDFVELCVLRRRDMRQLVQKFSGCSDVEAVLDRLQSEIGEINLPFTAANGSILMIIYEEQSQFRPINRAVLMEQFIDISLKKSSVEQSQRETFDYRNKTALLAYLAAWMAENNSYVVSAELLRQEMKNYVDRVGLNANLDKILNEFLLARILIRRPEGRISFRYRSILEYFIAQQMVNDLTFRAWVFEEDRYLSFTNEIQYYAGKLRNDGALVDIISTRFRALLHAAIGAEGVDLERLANLALPNKDSDVNSLDHLTEQLADQPMSQEQRDSELEADIPRDVEDRQEVFRPETESPVQKLLVSLFLYSGVLKNMELIEDPDKRRHLAIVWRGWGTFLHYALQVVSELVRQRKLRINGVLYELNAPLGMSNEELARLVALNMPIGIANLIATTLGTEKLERQLTEPTLEEANGPLVVEFFRASLIADLQLGAAIGALGDVLLRLRPSDYLREAMIWKIAYLRRHERLKNEDFEKLAPKVATAIAELKGGKIRDRDREKRHQMTRLKKEGNLLRLRKAMEDRAE